MTLGDRVNKCLIALGITQGVLATKCGWNKPSRLNHYINNRRKMPLDVAIKIAKALNCTPAWLAFEEGNPPAYLPNDIKLNGNFYHITWTELTNSLKENRHFITTTKSEIITLNNLDHDVFALVVPDKSMTALDSQDIVFTKGDLLLVDPKLNIPAHEDFVIAYENEWAEPLFAQYNMKGKKQYLKLLGDKQLLYISSNIKIIGTVIARLNFLT